MKILVLMTLVAISLFGMRQPNGQHEFGMIGETYMYAGCHWGWSTPTYYDPPHLASCPYKVTGLSMSKEGDITPSVKIAKAKPGKYCLEMTGEANVSHSSQSSVWAYWRLAVTSDSGNTFAEDDFFMKSQHNGSTFTHISYPTLRSCININTTLTNAKFRWWFRCNSPTGVGCSAVGITSGNTTFLALRLYRYPLK